MNARQNMGKTSPNLTILALDHGIPVPKAPAGTTFDAAERKTWRELWGSPVAAAWDDSVAPAVAAYVLYSHKIFRGEATAWVASSHASLADSLGLSPRGLRQLGYRIESMP